MATNSKNVKSTTDQGFHTDVIQSSQLALVDFWAEWCGPCRMLGPTLDQIADEFVGKMQIYKLNVDENPDVPQQFHIRGIPTMILFKNGQAVDQLVGNQPKASIIEAIQRHL